VLTALLTLSLAAAPSNYEERLIAWALEQTGREVELEPEGRVVEEVLIARENIFAPSDPWPTQLNIFHVETRDAVVRREVLLDEGAPWSQARALETERNLRKLFYLAVSRVVPVKGHRGGVAALVVTKDKWSLRLSNAFTLIGPLLQYLRLSLNEVNFNGWGQQLSADYTMNLDTMSFGETFLERRLFGSRVSLQESVALIFNRKTGGLEGSAGTIDLGQPLLTLDQAWGFDLTGSWNTKRQRVYRGAEVWAIPFPTAASSTTVPDVYDVREWGAQAALTRSVGRAVKLDGTVALGLYSHQYTPPKDLALSDEQTGWLSAHVLPRSEAASYVSGYARAYPADFRVLHDLDTFEFSEDYQVGWLAQAGARWAFPLPFAPSNFVQVGAALRYRFLLADDLLTLTVAAGERLRPQDIPANQRVAFEVSNYSPPFYGGRLVARVLGDFRRNDLDNTYVLLGGSNGLRGLPAEALSGHNLLLANVEYRARPFEFATTWVGLVFFYDAGSAFDGQVALTHTVGFGLRILLPQLNQDVIRLDFGMVLGGAAPGLDRLNASWGQVTDLRPAFLDQPL
jgi:hypothetical protein